MPKRKRTKGRDGRISKRRRSRRGRRRAIPRGLFANVTVQRFRYVDFITLNPPISGTSRHTIRGTSLYDPDFTGIGHQPRGFDQYMAFYEHFEVLGAKLTATFVPLLPTIVQNQAIVGIMQGPLGTPALTTLTDVLESKQSRTNVTRTMGTRPLVLTSKFSSKKVFGGGMGDDARKGTDSANPAENWYFHVWGGSTDEGSNDPTAIRVKLQIDFIAKLTERKKFGGS